MLNLRYNWYSISFKTLSLKKSAPCVKTGTAQLIKKLKTLEADKSRGQLNNSKLEKAQTELILDLQADKKESQRAFFRMGVSQMCNFQSLFSRQSHNEATIEVLCEIKSSQRIQNPEKYRQTKPKEQIGLATSYYNIVLGFKQIPYICFLRPIKTKEFSLKHGS